MNMKNNKKIFYNILTVFVFTILLSGCYSTIFDNPNDPLNKVNSFSWTQATSNAGWSARYKQTSAVFENKIWVLGGSFPSGATNEV